MPPGARSGSRRQAETVSHRATQGGSKGEVEEEEEGPLSAMSVRER